MAKYIQLCKSGDIYVANPPYEREGKGKFEMIQKLDQRDLEYLYEQGMTNAVIRIEETENTTPEETVKKKRGR